MSESGPAYSLYALIMPRLSETFSADAKAGINRLTKRKKYNL